MLLPLSAVGQAVAASWSSSRLERVYKRCLDELDHSRRFQIGKLSVLESAERLAASFDSTVRTHGDGWVRAIGLDPAAYGTHTLRRTKASLTYHRTKNGT